jgi:2-oxo-4-hydroxy-4-carboxy-5-ureidoimidazoline decarboxylase
MHEATDDVRRRLNDLNREYEARFGYIFIVCATGKPAGELLAALERRLPNPPGEELGIAAEEQRKITRLRLHKLLT